MAHLHESLTVNDLGYDKRPEPEFKSSSGCWYDPTANSEQFSYTEPKYWYFTTPDLTAYSIVYFSLGVVVGVLMSKSK